MIYRDAGYLILGSRLKRLGDRLLNEVRQVYKSLDIPFETSWFPAFYVLKEEGMCSIQELSEHLEVSHSAVSQLITQLQRRGLISIQISAQDQRRKEIVLTDKGMSLMDQVVPVWQALEDVFRSRLPADLLSEVNMLEESLNAGELAQAVLASLEGPENIGYAMSHDHSESIKHFAETNGLQLNDRLHFITASAAGRLIALMGYEPGAEGIPVRDFFVLPAYRRKGVGRNILERLREVHGDKPLIIRRTSPEMLHFLHAAGVSFHVEK
jgi:DNA-binding MarR family transcriptional regulator